MTRLIETDLTNIDGAASQLAAYEKAGSWHAHNNSLRILKRMAKRLPEISDGDAATLLEYADQLNLYGNKAYNFYAEVCGGNLDLATVLVYGLRHKLVNPQTVALAIDNGLCRMPQTHIDIGHILLQMRRSVNPEIIDQLAQPYVTPPTRPDAPPTGGGPPPLANKP